VENNINILFRLTSFNVNSISLLLNVLSKVEKKKKVYIAEDFKEVYEILTNVSSEEPLFLVYSFMTPYVEEVKQEIDTAKKFFPKVFTLAGGSHPSGDPQGCINIGFDFVFTGEGEVNFWNFFSKELWKEARGRVFNSVTPCVFNDYIPVSKWLRVCSPLEIMRGCFYRCKYCQTSSIYPLTPRYRDINSVCKYIELIQRQGFNRVDFLAPDGFSYGKKNKQDNNYKKLEELLKSASLEGKFPIKLGFFPSELRVDNISEDLLLLIKKYCNNKKVHIGAQSGSEEVLRRANRGHGVKEILTALELIYNLGFIPFVDFMIGLPEESYSERKETFKLIEFLQKKYSAFIQLHYFMPLPGTVWSTKAPSKLLKEEEKEIVKLTLGGQIKGYWKEQSAFYSKLIRWRKEGLVSY